MELARTVLRTAIEVCHVGTHFLVPSNRKQVTARTVAVVDAVDVVAEVVPAGPVMTATTAPA